MHGPLHLRCWATSPPAQNERESRQRGCWFPIEPGGARDSGRGRERFQTSATKPVKGRYITGRNIHWFSGRNARCCAPVQC
jgi:hypothetical protein